MGVASDRLGQRTIQLGPTRVILHSNWSHGHPFDPDFRLAALIDEPLETLTLDLRHFAWHTQTKGNIYEKLYLQGGPSNIWNLNRLYKKTLWIFFLKYGFIRKIEPFHLRMKHNIIQMTDTAGLTVRHSINPIFQYIFDSLSFNPMNGDFDFVFQGLNRLWIVKLTLILNGSPQKIVQEGKITAPRRRIDIRISADYSIFVNGAQKIDCYVGCVSSGPVLLKTNIVHVILFNFSKQKFVEHRLINNDVWIFWVPNATILLIDLLSKQSKIYWKTVLIEWGTVRPAVAVIWMMCFTLKWNGSIFLIKPYF